MTVQGVARVLGSAAAEAGGRGGSGQVLPALRAGLPVQECQDRQHSARLSAGGCFVGVVCECVCVSVVCVCVMGGPGRGGGGGGGWGGGGLQSILVAFLSDSLVSDSASYS